MPAYDLIVAFGSPLAAGPGIPPVANASAMRSANNYASELAGKLGARLIDLTAEPWVQPFHGEMMRTASSFHPNQLGMSAIAVQAERVLSP